MSKTTEFLWYIPNQVAAGHRGEPVSVDHNSLDVLTTQAKALESHGWDGALIGTGWGRPDTFTLATALTARTTTVDGGAILDKEGNMVGSIVLCRFPDRGALDAYLQRKVYARDKVWGDIEVVEMRFVDRPKLMAS